MTSKSLPESFLPESNILVSWEKIDSGCFLPFEWLKNINIQEADRDTDTILFIYIYIN